MKIADSITDLIGIARRASGKGKLIVAIIPSFGERYPSTPLFAGLGD